jgi:polysaccharide export outer membrane protein
MNSEISKTAAIALLLGGIAAAQVNAPPSGCSASASATNATGFSDRNPRYQLQSGDTFDIDFEFAPEFNQTTTVQPDGFITLRDVGDFHVSGQTVPQLTQTLCVAYGRIMVMPSLAVVLKDFEKPYFVAGGQVSHPGKYTLRGDTTLAEAIAMAGGFTEKSKHSQVLLFRRISDQWTEAKVVDVKRMLNAKNLGEDPLLKPGDMFVVPQNRISKIARFLPNTGITTYVNPTQF